MDNRPGPTPVSAASLAESYREAAGQNLIMLVFFVILAVAIGSKAGGTAVLVPAAIVYQGGRIYGYVQDARTARRVAADLASHPDAVGWKLMAALGDGPKSNDRLASFLVVDGLDYRYYQKGQLRERGTSTPVADDGEVEVTEDRVTEGHRTGQISHQLSIVRDDVLLSCMGTPGGPRPEGFFPNDDRFLSVWARVS